MKTKIIASLFAFTTLFTMVLAGELASFVVEVNPSTVKTGEPTDVTVKAIDADGNVVEDYKGDILFMVNNMDGVALDAKEYVSPNDGMYTFTEEDMGTKTFTKGLIVNKAGEFKVKVEDFESGNSGSSDIKVISQSTDNKGKVEITTPQNQEVITKTSITVVGTSMQYKNSKVRVLVDEKSSGEALIDSSGNYQIELSGLTNGEHKLKVEVLDIDGNVVSDSQKITITVNSDVELYKGITVLPSNEVAVGTEATINIQVDPSVSSVTLKIEGLGEFPMDRKTTDEFTTQAVINKVGKFDISADLTASDTTKSYEKLTQIVSLDKIAVHSVKFVRDNSEKTISLDWKFTGEVPKFKVEYGTGSNSYTQAPTVDENKYTIEHIEETQTYFVKISPVDSEGNVIGEPSKEVIIEPDMKKAATCTIDNIKTTVISSGDKNYFTWKEVEGAVKYVVFKGDNATDLDSVAELTGTSYELPYNPNAKKTEYAYFTVKAVCDDGNMKQIDKVKKIKVGPMDFFLYAIIITFILYGLRLALRDTK